MLAYLGTGNRDYAARPVGVYRRGVWEFQAIVAGEAAPVFPQRVGRLQGPRIHVFAPDCAHGWTGRPDGSCQVVVFHVAAVSDPIRQLASRNGCHDAPLSTDEAARLIAIGERLARDMVTPSDRSELLHQIAIAEASLLVLADTPPRPFVEGPALARQRVDAACAWYAEHLSRNPDLDEIAAAAHSSPAHLRRMFHLIHQTSPHTVLDRIRYQRAAELLADPERSMSSIAEECGFSAASALTRGFRAHYGVTPGAWRKRLATGWIPPWSLGVQHPT